MPFISLPTELIEQIASNLDLETFRSLRLTCSSLSEQSTHPFKDRFFRTRTLKWTKDDLDRLVLINSHPIYGSALQHLIIDATPRHSISLWQLRKRISDTEAISSDILGVSFKSELQEEYHLYSKEARDVAAFYNETRHDQKCLQAVFKQLPELDSITFEYEGMNKMYGKFGRRYCESSQHEMSRPFVSTMAAIAASSIRVNAISLGPINHHGAVSIGRLESLAPSLRSFDAAFENLGTLKLNLRDWRYPDTGFELENTRAPFVVRFLAKARNVKNLHLSCYSSLDDDLFGEMARHCKFSQLEACNLSLFRVQNASDLVKFLEPSSPTLRSLRLNHFVLRDESSSWPDLLCRLIAPKDNLMNLQALTFFNMFTSNGARLIQHNYHDMYRMYIDCIQTENWREKALRFVEAFSEGTSGPAWHLAAVAYPFLDMRT